MGTTVTSTASTGEISAGRRAPAPALLATWATETTIVQLALWDSLGLTVLPAQQVTMEPTALLLIHAKPLLPLPTMGLTVTSTASTGEISAGLRAPAPARIVTLGLAVIAAKTLTTSTTWTVY